MYSYQKVQVFVQPTYSFFDVKANNVKKQHCWTDFSSVRISIIL